LASQRYRPDFSARLIEEIMQRSDYLKGQKISSIYFGGGTPSLLGRQELAAIFDKLYAVFSIDPEAEITLEGNPDDISMEWIRELKTTPVNRLSMGVQSFRDQDLQYLNRIHSGTDALNAVKLLQDSGLGNLTIDLIYGIPGLGDMAWQQNLETFFSLGVPHLSAYSLTVEEKTPLHVLIARRKMDAPDENDSIRHFRILQDMCRDEGFRHYEISNFALDGHYSRHNSIYWTGGYYLGLGPSAHSFNGISRRWNVSSVKQWLEGNDTFGESFEEEVLTTDQRYNEYVMTSLRTMWGCSIDMVRMEFGDDRARHMMEEAKQHIDSGRIVVENDTLFLSDVGKLFADGIASDLFC